MFNTETLFILGAGASVPYGYPNGKELIQNIIDDMDDEIFIPKYLSEKPPPYWNEYDIKNNIFYDFNKCVDVLKKVAPYSDDVEQPYLSQRSGDGTLKIVFNHAHNKDHFTETFFRAKIKQIDIFNSLKNTLRIFDPISIDAFLRDNPSYAKAGKIMILYSLLKREDPNKFTINQCTDNWYPLLLNDLVSECADDPEKLSRNKIRFITFNYDVSLDFYLRSRIRQIEIFLKQHGNPSSPAESFLSTLEIKHVYGQLYTSVNYDAYGRYMEDSSEKKQLANINVDWGGRSSYSNPPVLPLSLIKNFKRFVYGFDQFDNIKTIYDERNSPIEKEKMISANSKAIRWAKESIFIGFGFDRDNLNMLGIPDNLFKFRKMFSGKTIRYLNYKGLMNSLAREFDKLERESKNGAKTHKNINVIQSTADSICSAYQNDFKKFLFR